MILVFIYNDEFIYLQNTSDKITKNLCIKPLSQKEK